MVNYKRPKIKTILAFLKANGWEAEPKENSYYSLKPPEEFKFDNPNFRARMPIRDEHFEDEAAYRMVQNIAQMYQIDLQELFDLFSKPIEVLRFQASLDTAGQEKVQEVLAHAS